MTDNIDLAWAFAQKVKDPRLPKNYTFDDFFDEHGVPKENRSDFAVAAIITQAKEKYGLIGVSSAEKG